MNQEWNFCKVTVFAEGCRGHLGKELIKKFELDKGKILNNMELVLKKFGKLDEENHEEGTCYAYSWMAIR